MKIAKLIAEDVHGYMPLRIEFFSDLTFLIGLNGSGKTSALRLLMALLMPNPEELGSIDFSTASVLIDNNGEPITIAAEKSKDGVFLSVTPQVEPFCITSEDLELYADARRKDELQSPVLRKLAASAVITRIREISTPMFLGLDRRFYAPGSFFEDISDKRRREYFVRRSWAQESSVRATGVAALSEVNYLVTTRLQEIRAEQEKLDERLRTDFFRSAFVYKPGNLSAAVKVPSRSDIDGYRDQLKKIENAAETVKIPMPEIQSSLATFFEKMTTVVDAIEQQYKSDSKKSSKPKKKDFSSFDRALFDWSINQPQVERILDNLRLLNEYVEKRDELRNPIKRFLELVNSFFEQTKKIVAVNPRGQLSVEMGGRTDSRSIGALSSGERQLLVMLAHLSLNLDLGKSGVFIVDEPEISLHIDWQERFVDAITRANPNVQLILATHSPAIILDRTDACRSLEVGVDRHA